jgi:hypothetical protein
MFVIGATESYVPSADEVQLSNLVMDYWTRFAAKGDPNRPHAFRWPRYTADDLILKLDVNPARLAGYHNPQCDFIEPLAPLFAQHPDLASPYWLRREVFGFGASCSAGQPTSPKSQESESVPETELLMTAYRELEDSIRKALKEHRGNRSVMSTMLNTLLLYPDHPYGLGTLYGKEFDEELKRNVRFVIAETRDLPEEQLYSKERRLIEEIKKELAEGRRCQIFAVYTQKHDVTARLARVLSKKGIRTEVLRASVDTSKGEAWYARQIKERVQVVISHPRLVETGLDLLDFPTIIFYESGYSLHTLRQASRRSWRIGQRRPVRVKFLCYEGTMQTACLRLMGKKLLVALTMEGKFAGEGLQNIDEDDDMLSAMARELVESNGIGQSADAVWKALNAEHQRQFPTAPESLAEVASPAFAGNVLQSGCAAHVLVEEMIGSSSLLTFGQRPGSRRRVCRKPSVPEQASLFG